MPGSFPELLTALSDAPPGVGLTDSTGTLSYRDLAQAVSAEAAQIQAQYLPGTRFLVPAPHDQTFVRDWLALMCAGMLVIPTPPHLPAATLQQLRTQFRAMLWQSEGTENTAPQPNGARSPTAAIERSACMALLTSGSSGETKAACFLPEALFWNAQAVRQHQALTDPGRLAIHLPLHHAFGLVTQLLPALMAASPVHLWPQQLLPGDLLKRLREAEIETFAAVPSTLRWMLQGHPAPYSGLRHLSIAGAALHPEEIPALCAAFPAARIWIGYGLTEAGPRVSAFANDDPEFGSGSAGRPLPGIQIKILAEEVWVKTPSAMLGYLDAPELSAETLQTGWLKTGDSGYLSASGALFITGRLDDTLLSGGEKVAPLAVERTLLSHTGILQAAVYGEADPILGSHLVALIVPRPEAELPTLHGLRQFCKAHLEPHQIPRQFYRVSQLPLTPNGKLLRKELPSWPKQPWS